MWLMFEDLMGSVVGSLNKAKFITHKTARLKTYVHNAAFQSNKCNKYYEKVTSLHFNKLSHK